MVFEKIEVCNFKVLVIILTTDYTIDYLYNLDLCSYIVWLVYTPGLLGISDKVFSFHTGT